MASTQGPRQSIPQAVRALPADLAAVVFLVVLTDLVVLLPVVRETPVRVVLGLPLVLFLPGYALVAALFPETGDVPASGAADQDASSGTRGIDGIERVALSVGLSIAVVPLIGLLLNFTPWGITLVPVLLSVSGVTVAAAAIATLRRWELPPEERFSVPYREWVGSLRKDVLDSGTRSGAALNLLLALSVVLALGSVAYAVTVPNQGEQFTEFYVLSESEDGDLVAADYPTEFVRGESRPVVLGIENHEHRSTEYTVVVELQRIGIQNGSATVIEERELDRLRVTVADNDTWTTDYAVTPTMTGERLRAAFLLYVGEPPADPTVENAYREVHLRVNVSAP